MSDKTYRFMTPLGVISVSMPDTLTHDQQSTMWQCLSTQATRAAADPTFQLFFTSYNRKTPAWLLPFKRLYWRWLVFAGRVVPSKP